MSCDDIRPLLADRQHRTFAHAQLVQTHLQQCAACRDAAQRQDRARRLVQSVTVPAPHVPPARLTAIRTMLATPHHPWRVHYGGRRSVLYAALCTSPLLVYLLLVLALPRPGTPPTAAPATANPPTPQTTLYVVGTVMNHNPPQARGFRLTAIDRTTWRERYRIADVDEATLSPDGTRLYAAGRRTYESSDDVLHAFDAQDGHELWQTPLLHRAEYPGQQTLLVSPDGRWLYVRSTDIAQGSGDATTVPFWLQVFDTRDGRQLDTTIALPGIDECAAPRVASPPSGTLAYLSCSSGKILAVDGIALRLEQPFAWRVTGMVFPVGASEVVALSSGLRLNRIDAATQALRASVILQAEPSLAPSYTALGVSANGSRAIAGQTIQGVPGTDTATEVGVFDTTNGTQIGRWRYERPLQNLIVDAAGETLYGMWTEFTGVDSAIVEFGLPSGTQRTVHGRAGEATRQLFLGP